MSTTQLGPRPESSTGISYSPECFEVVGTKTVYLSKNPISGNWDRFESMEALMAKPSRRNRPMATAEETITRRIKWSI